MSELCRALVLIGCSSNPCCLLLFFYLNVDFYDSVTCKNNDVGVQEHTVHVRNTGRVNSPTVDVFLYARVAPLRPSRYTVLPHLWVGLSRGGVP